MHSVLLDQSKQLTSKAKQHVHSFELLAVASMLCLLFLQLTALGHSLWVAHHTNTAAESDWV